MSVKKSFGLCLTVIFVSIVLYVCLLTGSFSEKAYALTGKEFDCNVFAAEADGASVIYGSTNVIKYTNEEAVDAGIPEGFERNVYAVEQNNYVYGKGSKIDFTAFNIPVGFLESVSFKVYVGDDGVSDAYPELLIHRTDGADDWVMRYDMRSFTNGWTEITLLSDGTNFNGNHLFSDLSENGVLGAFELAVRCDKDVPFYIDSITCELSDFVCALSSAEANGNDVIYGSTGLVKYTYDEAVSAEIPAGFEGSVYAVEHSGFSSGKGVRLDFSLLNLKSDEIRSVSFKVYVGDDGVSDAYPELRIHRTDGADDWVMRYDMRSFTNGWTEITLLSDGTNFNGNHTFSDLSENGVLGAFELAVRCSRDIPFYIDSITVVENKDDDPPVIIYNGETTLYIEENSILNLDVRAEDDVDGEVSVEYVWENKNSLNDDGSVKRGKHVLTIRATDEAANQSSLVITVIAGQEDVEPPTITIAVSEMHLLTGSKPCFEPTATDDGVLVSVYGEWSANAIDDCGKLLTGTHFYTIKAEDSFGNETQKVITVYVYDENPAAEIIEDENEKFVDTVQCGIYSETDTDEGFIELLQRGDVFVLPECPFVAPAKHYFGGWAARSLSGEIMAAGESISVSEDSVFFALWKTDGETDENPELPEDPVTPIKTTKVLQSFDWEYPFNASLWTAFDESDPDHYPGNTENHCTEGNAAMKMTSIANYQMILINLKVNGNVLTAEELDKIESISIDIYAELPEGLAGADFFYFNQNMGWLVAGANTLTITGEEFKAQMTGSANGVAAYNSDTGWAYFQIASAGITLYFDNCVATYK